ncbi:hypothetical protein N7497_009410, partial [Penicillium chrysogenum]
RIPLKQQPSALHCRQILDYRQRRGHTAVAHLVLVTASLSIYVADISATTWVTFIFMALFMFLGFGPAGIVAGSLAAAFQSFMYGAFTPAGGIFATLTSMAMLGTLMPLEVLVASALAVGVAVGAVVWKVAL